MKFDWQWIICGLLLIGAIYYVIKTVKKTVTEEHDCPECGVPVKKGQHIKPHKPVN